MNARPSGILVSIIVMKEFFTQLQGGRLEGARDRSSDSADGPGTGALPTEPCYGHLRRSLTMPARNRCGSAGADLAGVQVT